MIRFARRRANEASGRHPRFTDGLVAGALIGAAIAGSTLWSRLRRGGRLDPPAATEPPRAIAPAEDPAPG